MFFYNFFRKAFNIRMTVFYFFQYGFFLLKMFLYNLIKLLNRHGTRPQ